MLVEEIVLANINKTFPQAHRMVGYCKEFDIWIPEINKSVEVKYDPMSNETGNIVIEVEMFGKPSALETTKADWWIFYDDKQFVCLDPEKIRNCIKENKLTCREFIGNGDTVKKKAYLVKKELLFKYGKQLSWI